MTFREEKKVLQACAHMGVHMRASSQWADAAAADDDDAGSQSAMMNCCADMLRYA